MSVLLVSRHGESELSARRIANGDPGAACPLTTAGRAQARALGEALEYEVVEIASFDQFDGGLNAVVRVAGAAANAERTAAREPEARLSVTHASR